jgi:hypothetical protein
LLSSVRVLLKEAKVHRGELRTVRSISGYLHQERQGQWSCKSKILLQRKLLEAENLLEILLTVALGCGIQ